MGGLLNEEAARDFLGGVSVQTLIRIRKAEKLEPVRVGKRTMYRESDLARLIDQGVIRTAAGNGTAR